MDVAEMNSLERRLPSRGEHFRIGGRGLREGDRERIHGRRLAESEKRITELRRRLAEGRDAAQIVRDDGALLG